MYCMEKDTEHLSENEPKIELRRKLGRRSAMPELNLDEPLGLASMNSYELPDGTVYHYDAAPIPK